MRRRDFLCSATACGALSLTPHAVFARGAPRRFASFDPLIRPLLARMTLDEKLGQMAQGELHNIKDENDVVRYALGSVLSGGDADPAAGNGFAAWRDTIDRFVALSRTTRLRIPLLYGVDAVHGHNNVEGAVIFPHNVGLGATRNAALVEEVARVTALEVRATGAQWTFAPCVAVPRDARWGRAYEGFSEDPSVCATLGAAAVRGLQSPDLASRTAVLATAKHYVGDGGTSFRPRAPGARTLLDQGDTQVDEATLRSVHLPPYLAAIAAGVGSIMVSYSSWNGEKVSGHHQLLTAILKQELGFEGFVVSDYYAIGQVDRDYKRAVLKCVNAGMDMAMEPAGYARFISVLKELVNEGRVPLARIDDAVTRILRVKWAMGLMEPRPLVRADRALQSAFGSAAHRAVARRAVRESLVLLKNSPGALPLQPDIAHLHIAGRGADDIGIQCGGWTIKWQGSPGAITAGTTLRAALAAGVARGTRVSTSVDGTGAEGAQVAIAVVSELPYAEGVGDRESLDLDPADVAMVKRLAATGARVIVLVICGRPLILEPLLDEAAAVVACWLPGTEGDGVADVLFGRHAPGGKLPVTWPRATAGEPANLGDAGRPVLFAFGHGLTY